MVTRAQGDRGHDRPEPQIAQVDGVRLRGREVPGKRDHEDAGEGAALQARLSLHQHLAGKRTAQPRDNCWLLRPSNLYAKQGEDLLPSRHSSSKSIAL